MADGKKKPAAPAGDLLTRLLAKDGKLRVPHLEDVAAAFIGEMGGPGAFARSLFDDYTAAAPGSLQRVKIMDLILRGLRGSQAAVDLKNLSEDDLTRYLAAKVDEYQEQAGGPARHPAGVEGQEAAAPAPGAAAG